MALMDDVLKAFVPEFKRVVEKDEESILYFCTPIKQCAGLQQLSMFGYISTVLATQVLLIKLLYKFSWHAIKNRPNCPEYLSETHKRGGSFLHWDPKCNFILPSMFWEHTLLIRVEFCLNPCSSVYVEMTDLLRDFDDPAVMDIKMGIRYVGQTQLKECLNVPPMIEPLSCRTYLEEELLKARVQKALRKVQCQHQ